MKQAQGVRFSIKAVRCIATYTLPVEPFHDPVYTRKLFRFCSGEIEAAFAASFRPHLRQIVLKRLGTFFQCQPSIS
jgi:hypothetical protein